MKLYFIRHGQTMANVDNWFAGQTDVPLTENGVVQAKAAAKKIEDVEFKAVYSSDLSRAITTQKLMLPDRTAITTPLLREFALGELTNKKSPNARQSTVSSLLSIRLPTTTVATAVRVQKTCRRVL